MNEDEKILTADMKRSGYPCAAVLQEDQGRSGCCIGTAYYNCK